MFEDVSTHNQGFDVIRYPEARGILRLDVPGGEILRCVRVISLFTSFAKKLPSLYPLYCGLH